MQQVPKLVRGLRRLAHFDLDLAAQLPEAYKKFWREWKQAAPVPLKVYAGEGDQNVQNIPWPLEDYPGSLRGKWIVKSFRRLRPQKRRVPHFWFPTLKRSVIYSKVLNEYMSLIMTKRFKAIVYESRGFDHYLLKNLACDLRSLLAFKLKRKILLELLNGCPNWAHNPNEQQLVLQEYKPYVEAYTPDEIDWYGYTLIEAIAKMQAQLRAENSVDSNKVNFRTKLITALENRGIREAGSSDEIPTKQSSGDENADFRRTIDSLDLEEPDETGKKKK